MNNGFEIPPEQEQAYLTFLERIENKDVVSCLQDAEHTLASIVDGATIHRRRTIRGGLIATLDLYKAYPPKDPTFAGMRKHFPEAYGAIMASLFKATQQYGVKF